MECPFELPAYKNITDLGFEVTDGNLKTLFRNLTEKEADYIVQAINSHEKFKTVVQNLVSSATKYPDDYATKELNQLIPFLIKEAKQALEAEKKD